MFSGVEHEKSFITSGPGVFAQLSKLICVFILCI